LPPVVLFENFSFQYRAQTEPTLVDINLKVDRGEKLLILGPSGSGKSTLLHCINGIIPHDFKGEISGRCLLLDKDVREYDIFSISKIAGTVLQDTDGQFVGMNAAEDIAFALENDCVPTKEMRLRVAKTAALVDMEAHLDKSPHDLSGGQKQRISLAGILVDDVEILLFDEPLANLDPRAGKDAIELIDELHKKTGKTVIIVEHRLEDVLHRPVDRVVVLDKGRITADTIPAEILASGILKKTGIREPLYISALEYSGITIDASMEPQHLDTLMVDYRQLGEWDRELSIRAARDAEKKTCVQGPGLQIGLQVSDVHFRYAKQGPEALKGVSFTVAPGECVGLVGKNGAGKSTMAKCVCGFVHPDSGAIYYGGRDLAALSIMERAEKIGYVMQNPNQMISSPMIFDEVALGLRTDRKSVV
jgi:energy-coupling factor transport system ATP-binding protein